MKFSFEVELTPFSEMYVDPEEMHHKLLMILAEGVANNLVQITHDGYRFEGMYRKL